MKKIIILFLIFPLFITAQTMRESSFRSLFSDYKAATLGDAVTIIVVESSQATNQAETATGRKSDLGFGASGGLGESALPNVDLDIGSNNDFKGSGSTKSSGMVKTKISALIDSVMSNGLLRIKGSRKIVINGEEQKVTIRGVVRTSDIRSDNTVYSYNISDAEIVFDGSGQIESVQSPGWLTKLFHWIF